MPKFYRAEATKEIYWDGKTYRRGDAITVLDTDVELLRTAGVIGDVKRFIPEIEMATVAPPENASRNYGRKGR